MSESPQLTHSGESITIRCEGSASHVAQHFTAGLRLVVTGIERIDHGPAEGVVFLTVIVETATDEDQEEPEGIRAGAFIDDEGLA